VFKDFEKVKSLSKLVFLDVKRLSNEISDNSQSFQVPKEWKIPPEKNFPLCIVLSYLPFFQLEIEGRKET
jgi:hypothetical protein